MIDLPQFDFTQLDLDVTVLMRHDPFLWNNREHLFSKAEEQLNSIHRYGRTKRRVINYELENE